METSGAPPQQCSSGTPAQDGSKHQLPKQLESIVAAMEFPPFRQRWNTNEELASMLIAFDQHKHWQLKEIKLRPPSGSLLFYSRNKVRYRKDGYCWKKRKDGKTIREDHMKLKVQGLECIYGSYVHSAILPTFHRRCYWLLQNPDIVLVHYLNVPYPNSTKLTIPIVSFAMEKKEWTKDELYDQLHPMFSTCQGQGERTQAIDEVVSALVQRLIDHQDQRNTCHKCDAECDKNCVHSASVGGAQATRERGSVLSVLGAQTPTVAHHPHSYAQSQGVAAHTTPFIVNLVNVSTSNLMLVSSPATSQLPNLAAASSSMGNGASSCSQQTLAQLEPSTSNTHIPASTHVHSQPHSTGCAGHGNVISSHPTIPCIIPQLKEEAAGNQQSGNQSITPTQLLTRDIQGIQLCEQTFFSSNTMLPNMDHKQSLTSSHSQCVNAGLVPMQLTADTGIGGTDSVDSSQMGAFNFDILATTDKGHQASADCSASPDLSSDNLDLSVLQGGELNLDHIDLLDLPDLEKLCCDMLAANPQEAAVSVSADHSSSLDDSKDLLSSCQSRSHNDSLDLKSGSYTTDCSHSSAMSPRGGVSLGASDISSQCYTGQSSCSPTKDALITDFSPDWAYTEGQCKVLVTGPWFSKTGTYTILIGGKVIGTTLVQPGVLRCFVPAHPPGLVTLQVSCDRVIISNTVVFEYREGVKPATAASTSANSSLCKSKDWFSVPDEDLQIHLLNKLDFLHTLLRPSMDPSQNMMKTVPDTTSLKQKLPSCESAAMVDMCLVGHLEMVNSFDWTSDDFDIPEAYMGVSMLHIAAALGYHRVISALIRWRTNTPGRFLEYEVDAHSVDDNSCSPLMWACAKGHFDSAVTLYNWNSASINIKNKEGNQAILIARQHGHHHLADHISQLAGYQSGVADDTVFVQPQSQLSPDFLATSRDTAGSLQAATPSSSTPVSKATCPVFKSPQSFVVGSQGLGSLQIDIPAASSAGNQKDKITRRQSEQILKLSRQKLKKRLSVDLLPSDSDQRNQSPTSSFQRPIREANSEPHLPMKMEHLTRQYNPMLCDPNTDLSPDMMIDGLTNQDRFGRLIAGQPTSMAVTGHSPVQMDTDDSQSDRSNSPFIDVEKVSSDEDDLDRGTLGERQAGADNSEDSNHQMIHLAKQIIAAIPERIKLSPSRCVGDQIATEASERERSSSYSSQQSHSPHASSSYGDDSGISTPMRDSLAFDEYRYSDLDTPASSLSPDSTCLHSPYSPYGFQLDSPPPTTADFTEYFNAPATFMEKDFSQLTLSDREQRKLYEAAKVIQSAYRMYRDKQCQQQRKEIEAAVLIQSYYRRYKQYAYYKKMTQAAVLIQSQFRSYYAQKRFKKSRDAAVVIQNQYRSYKEHERLKKGGSKSVIQRYRSHYQRKLMGGAGTSEKGSRVIQVVPDGGDGCPPETSTTTGDSHRVTEEAGGEETDRRTDTPCDQKPSEV